MLRKAQLSRAYLRANRRTAYKYGSLGEQMKIVVTGGAGFIGANLCRYLLAQPDVREVVALDDLSTGSRQNLAGTDADLVEGTILDPKLLAAVFRGAHAVVH